MITSIKKARTMLKEIKEICNYIISSGSCCQSCPFGLMGHDRNRCFFWFDEKDQRTKKPIPADWETELIWCKRTKGD